MNLDNTKVKREFVSSITLETESIGRNKYTIESEHKHLNGKIFYSETITPRTSPFTHGLGKTEYFIKGLEKTYSTPLELVKAIKL